MNIGSFAFDRRTLQTVVIVAGAQRGGYVTVKFIDGTVSAIKISDLA